MASDARPAKRHRSSGSRWLVLDDPLKLLAKVLCPPWEDDGEEVEDADFEVVDSEEDES